MPLAKYYCDYCDKQFQDTPSARKRHLQGIQHQRAKALWYDSLRFQSHSQDPNRLQTDGLEKGVCHRFVRTGFCQYGDACKYFHPKPNIQNPTQVLSGHVASDSSGISMGNIPPSLRLPPEGGYPPLPFVDWG